MKPCSKEQKAAIPLHVTVQDAIDMFNTPNLSPEEAKDYDVSVKAFENYCLFKRNETYIMICISLASSGAQRANRTVVLGFATERKNVQLRGFTKFHAAGPNRVWHLQHLLR